jgi:type II secretory pathway component PulK
MKCLRERGSTLVVGLMLLAVVMLLGLAGAAGARIEQQLARNDQFRENAVSAASAGIEHAITRIVTSSNPDAVPSTLSATLPGSVDRYEAVMRFAGYDAALPQVPGANLAGAHFEITSTGHSARNTADLQRAGVMLVVSAPPGVLAMDCAPDEGIQCFELGELVRLSWQRLPAP